MSGRPGDAEPPRPPLELGDPVRGRVRAQGCASPAIPRRVPCRLARPVDPAEKCDRPQKKYADLEGRAFFLNAAAPARGARLGADPLENRAIDPKKCADLDLGLGERSTPRDNDRLQTDINDQDHLYRSMEFME